MLARAAQELDRLGLGSKLLAEPEADAAAILNPEPAWSRAVLPAVDRALATRAAARQVSPQYD